MSKNGVRTTDTAVADTHGYRSSRLPSTMAVIRRRTRRLGLVATAAIVLWFATACEPAPPTATFTVNVAAGIAGDDVNPGDGVCETAPGNAQCTLDAAVQEGNALGQADINVPAQPAGSGAHIATTLTITGDITIRSNANPLIDAVTMSADVVTIAAGARLAIYGTAIDTGDFVVDGTFIADRSALVGYAVVESTGTALVTNTVLLPGSRGAHQPGTATVTNRGHVAIRYSLVRGTGPGSAAVLTETGATTDLGASDLLGNGPSHPRGSACAGSAPTSSGYNLAPGCALTGPGDLDWDDPPITRDQSPNGSLGCGSEVTTDLYGRSRPSDDDGDSVAACDIGPAEGPHPT